MRDKLCTIRFEPMRPRREDSAGHPRPASKATNRVGLVIDTRLRNTGTDASEHRAGGSDQALIFSISASDRAKLT